LTEKGEENAKEILKKHLVFEDYFKKTRTENEAHKIAHILEHLWTRDYFKKEPEEGYFI